MCEFNFYITDINASERRHIKTLMPNRVPSVCTFMNKKSSENQPKRRSPRKDHLIIEFVKSMQKEINI